MAPDNSVVNGWIMEFARQLNDLYKQTDADRIGATTSKEKDEANTKLKTVRQPLGQVLQTLTKRQLSGKGTVFVADTLAAVGLTDEASAAYEEILKRLDTDEEFKKAAGNARTRVRTQLIELQATKGNYDKAVKEVDQLIEDNPKALEPLMTKGRILQQWSEKEASHYPEAVRHWAKVRNTLEGMKKTPPEFYEVSYNVAACLLYQARTEKDKAEGIKRALDGEKLLKSMMFKKKELNGPDMVARYKDLLTKLIVAQGRKPEPEKPEPKDTKPAPKDAGTAAKKP